VNYVIASQWGNGFTANVSITNNTGTAVNGWTLNWTHAAGQQVTSAWNATVTQTVNNVTASNPAGHWNGTIPANGGSVSFGFQGTHTGVVIIPAAFTLNGQACNQAGPTPTATSIPPTATTQLPTATPTAVPPTATSQPPTVTPTTSPPTATVPPPTPTTVPPTATPGGGAACDVNYTVTNQWGSGFLAEVIITNTGSSAINGWVLTFTFPGNQTITNLWNGNVSQTGTAVTVSNAPWNSVINPTSSVMFGFQATFSGVNNNPTMFRLNGQVCD
jgi:cellulase/cellobiase CelA1